MQEMDTKAKEREKIWAQVAEAMVQFDQEKSSMMQDTARIQVIIIKRFHLVL